MMDGSYIGTREWSSRDFDLSRRQAVLRPALNGLRLLLGAFCAAEFCVCIACLPFYMEGPGRAASSGAQIFALSLQGFTLAAGAAIGWISLSAALTPTETFLGRANRIVRQDYVLDSAEPHGTVEILHARVAAATAPRFQWGVEPRSYDSGVSLAAEHMWNFIEQQPDPAWPHGRPRLAAPLEWCIGHLPALLCVAGAMLFLPLGFGKRADYPELADAMWVQMEASICIVLALLANSACVGAILRNAWLLEAMALASRLSAAYLSSEAARK